MWSDREPSADIPDIFDYPESGGGRGIMRKGASPEQPRPTKLTARKSGGKNKRGKSGPHLEHVESSWVGLQRIIKGLSDSGDLTVQQQAYAQKIANAKPSGKKDLVANDGFRDAFGIVTSSDYATNQKLIQAAGLRPAHDNMIRRNRAIADATKHGMPTPGGSFDNPKDFSTPPVPPTPPSRAHDVMGGFEGKSFDREAAAEAAGSSESPQHTKKPQQSSASPSAEAMAKFTEESKAIDDMAADPGIALGQGAREQKKTHAVYVENEDGNLSFSGMETGEDDAKDEDKGPSSSLDKIIAHNRMNTRAREGNQESYSKRARIHQRLDAESKTRDAFEKGSFDINGNEMKSGKLDGVGDGGPASANQQRAVDSEERQAGLAGGERDDQHAQRAGDVAAKAPARPEGVAAGNSGLGGSQQYDFVTGMGRESGGENKDNINMSRGDQHTYLEDRRNRMAMGNSGTNVMDGKTNEFYHNLNKAADEANLGDEILGPKTHNTANASLRPTFLQGGADNLNRSPEERIRMDVNFDLFDFVPDGFGLGADNKMFVMEQERDRQIRYAEPMFEPAAPDDIITNNGLEPVDRRLRQVMRPKQIVGNLMRTMNDAADMYEVQMKQGVKSMNALPSDNNTDKSSKGLRGNKPSPFESVIQLHSPFLPVFDPAGVNMTRSFKSIFSPQRDPMRTTEFNPHNGFPTLSKRRALDIILP